MFKEWTQPDAFVALRAPMTIPAINRPIADYLHVKSLARQNASECEMQGDR
jgi:hypothetical protein